MWRESGTTSSRRCGRRTRPLLVRIADLEADLEATTDEYRRQMAGLLNSPSWGVTAAPECRG